MKKLFLVAALCLSTSAMAEVWFAAGLLTTQGKGQAAKVEFIETDGFDSRATCQHFINSEAFSKEHIGVGGTNGKLPAVNWNYDGDCWLKRSD